MAQHRPSIYARIYLRPPQIDAADDGAQIVVFECAPVSYKVICNSHYVADTWEMTFELNDFPLDPRLVRGATVEIFAADLSGPGVARRAEDYWAGLSHAEEVDHCLIAGVLDHIESPFDGDGLSLKMKGRDYTAYFLDVQLSAPIRWSSAKSFVELIGELIVQRPETQAMSIEIVVDGSTRVLDPRSGVPFMQQAAQLDATLEPTSEGVFRVLQIKPSDYKAFGTDATKDKRMKRDGETTWEAIQEIALEAGLIVYVELDRIVIREPNTLNPTDVQRLLRGKGEAYRFTVGRNVSRFTPSRDLGRQTNTNIQVSSFNPMTGKTLTVYSPPLAEQEIDNAGSAGPVGDQTTKAGKPTKNRTVTPYVVRGITSKVQLEAIAKSIREQIQHHDLEVEIETDSMVDSGGRGLWTMSYADTVVFDFSATLRSFITRTVEEQVQELTERGFDARDINTLLSGGEDDALGGFLGQLQAPLTLSEITYDYSTEGNRGWSVSMRLRARKQATVTVQVSPTIDIQVASG